MSTLQSVSIGSGTLPHVGPSFPPLQSEYPSSRYPVENNRDSLRGRIGNSVVLINPEDFSVHIGIRDQSLSVTSSAAPLPSVPFEYRRSLTITNMGPGVLYIGASGVTTSRGTPLFVNEKIAIDNQNLVVYGISDSTSDVRILELA